MFLKYVMQQCHLLIHELHVMNNQPEWAEPASGHSLWAMDCMLLTYMFALQNGNQSFPFLENYRTV
jgi:hypothetical protein